MMMKEQGPRHRGLKMKKQGPLKKHRGLMMKEMKPQGLKIKEMKPQNQWYEIDDRSLIQTNEKHAPKRRK